MGQFRLNTIPSNMKFLVLSACLAISCGQLSSWRDLVHHSNGAVVPSDTPAVAAAKAAFHKATGVTGNAAGPPVNHANGAARSAHPVARPAQPAAKPAQPVAAYVQKGEANMAARRAHLAALAN